MRRAMVHYGGRYQAEMRRLLLPNRTAGRKKRGLEESRDWQGVRGQGAGATFLALVREGIGV